MVGFVVWMDWLVGLVVWVGWLVGLYNTYYGNQTRTCVIQFLTSANPRAEASVLYVVCIHRVRLKFKL